MSMPKLRLSKGDAVRKPNTALERLVGYRIHSWYFARTVQLIFISGGALSITLIVPALLLWNVLFVFTSLRSKRSGMVPLSLLVARSALLLLVASQPRAVDFWSIYVIVTDLSRTAHSIRQLNIPNGTAKLNWVIIYYLNFHWILAPPYEALSHTWDVRSELTDLLCENATANRTKSSVVCSNKGALYGATGSRK